MTEPTDRPSIADLRREGATTNVETARRVLGLSRASIYRAIKRGDIPVLRIGSSVRVRVDQLIAMIDPDAELAPASAPVPETLPDPDPGPVDTAIGDACRQARKDLGLTQVQLAKRMGVSQGVVSLWERGLSGPPLYLPLVIKSVASDIDRENALAQLSRIQIELGLIIEQLES